MTAIDRLKAAGVAPSHQRIRIFEVLAGTRAHPSADAIHRELSPELPTLSRTTVYATLDLFARAGLVQRLALSGSELRYDADVTPHVHFRCRSCGAVSDLPGRRAPAFPSAPQGYVVESAQFSAEGLCPGCAAANPAGAARA
jgi:Fur family transcriptional regulator, peroxide stress response regulator